MKGLVYTPLCLPLVSGADTKESPLRDSGPDTEEQTSPLRLPLVSGADTEEHTSPLSLPLVPGQKNGLHLCLRIRKQMQSQSASQKGTLHTFVPSSSLRCRYRGITFVRLWFRYRRIDFTFEPPLVPGADTEEQTSPLSKNQETNAV